MSLSSTKSHKNQFFILDFPNKFNIYKYLPRYYTISTGNNSYKFNIDILKDISQTIRTLLEKNPQNLHYDLKTKDDSNVMFQFEQLFLNQTITMTNRGEINILKRICGELRIELFSSSKFAHNNSKKIHLISSIEETGKSIKAVLKINSTDEFSTYLSKKYESTFTITTKKKEYHCNIVGVNSSEIIRELLTKDPDLNHYEYDFDDEFNEFQEICNLFNFEKVTMTSDNIESIKMISEELQIDAILPYINEFYDDYKKLLQLVDDNQPIIDSINELFDILYKIKEITVNIARDKIIESEWCKTEENVQELAAFILQVIKKECTLHSYIADLIELLNKEANESNKLKIFVPFLIKMLKNSFYENSNAISFSFILCKKGLMEKEQIKEYLTINLNDLVKTQILKSSFILFLPELYEHLGRNTTKLLPYFPRNTHNFIISCMKNNFERIKKMRDEGEPDDKVTKALRSDDVDALQSFVSINHIDINKAIVPFNLYEIYVQNDKTNYINYSAAYGSLKCFKYLLLNHAELDNSSFKFAVYGGNNEIIKIVDQHARDLKEKEMNNNNYSRNFKSQKNESIIIALIKHQNDLFDWLFQQKYQDILDNDDLIKNILEISSSNGNIHSIVSLCDKGFNLLNIDNKLLQNIIDKVSQNGFYHLLKFILNLIDKKIKEIDYKSYIYSGNLSIFKLVYDQKKLANSELKEILQYAISNEFINIVEYIFDNICSEKSIFTQNFCYSLLSESIKPKSNNIFNYLLKKFETIESKPLLNFDNFYFNLLSEACHLNRIEIAKMLINFIYDKNLEFSIPFLNAATNGSTEICQLLIDLKVFINYELVLVQIKYLCNINKDVLDIIKNNYQYTKEAFNNSYLIEAIQNKNKNLIEYILIENQAIDDALFKAVETNDFEIVDMILNSNSKPSFINQISKNGTALDLAVESKNIEIVKRLLSVPGINPDLYKSGMESSPLITSLLYSNFEIANAILDFYIANDSQQPKWQINESFKLLLSIIANNSYDNKSPILTVLSRFIEIESVDLNCISDDNNLITLACITNNIDIVKMLIKIERVDVNSYESTYGNSPLMIAIDDFNLDIIKLLIDCDRVNINHRNYNKETALTFSVKTNQIDVFDLIINHKNFDPFESRLNYAFYLAKGEILNKLITLKDIDVNYKNVNNSTSLISAIQNSDSEKVDLIINHQSFNPYKSCIKEAIFKALENNDIENFRKLLKIINNDVNIINESNESLIKVAVKNNYSNMVTEILNNENFDSKKNNFYDSFVYAFRQCLTNNFDIIQKLVDFDKIHDKLINFKGILPNGKSFFTYYNSFNNSDIIKKLVAFLMKNGADPNAPDKNGVYPLQHAIQIRCFDLAKELIDTGKIDFSIRINDMNLSIRTKSYLHLAVEKNDLNILSLLIDSKLIDVNVTDSVGRTALFDACLCKSSEIIKKLFEVDDLDYLHKDNNGDDALIILQNKYPNKRVGPAETKEKYRDNLLKLLNENNDFHLKSKPNVKGWSIKK